MNTDDADRESFAIEPLLPWFLMCSSLFFVAVFILLSLPDLLSNPSKVPPIVWIGGLAFVGCFALGIYYKTLNVLVGDTTLQVSSVFGRRVTALSDIASVVVKDNGQWRTMDVKDRRNRRVLYISTTGFTGFDRLADLLSVSASARVKT